MNNFLVDAESAKRIGRCILCSIFDTIQIGYQIPKALRVVLQYALDVVGIQFAG